MTDLIQAIVRPLVEHPHEIRITGLHGEKTCIYELRCNQGDVGKVIGKKGKTIAAIRTLLNAVSSREGKKAVLEVVE